MGMSQNTEIRLSPSVFGIRNVNLLILVTLSMGNWKNPLVSWERLPECILITEW